MVHIYNNVNITNILTYIHKMHSFMLIIDNMYCYHNNININILTRWNGIDVVN